MKDNRFIKAITFFSILFSLSTFAQGPPGGGGQGRQGGGQQRGQAPSALDILAKFDLNKDEVIDRDEASKDRRGKLSEDFNMIDENSDAVIDIKEIKASLNNRKSRKKKIAPKNIIKQVDDNGDGTLNELELAAKNKKNIIKSFKEIDTNNDGELDLNELQVFFKIKGQAKVKRNKRIK